ncbi:hypothetical protein Tsubulata_020340 [Turnera subulata]|uniref:DUF4228 domain-containing protein n=1 Tax=Turnera subulata TaxID=218843 RepID=A0A9Q0J4Y4_9ROSI|nr:hypothetical protein Tsubulata_020340 [Turnera subulata]
MSCTHLRPKSQAETIKLIKSDGLVKIYDRPIHVSELMLQFPKHLVCRSDSFYIGQKIPALSENDQLQLGHKYFLLPKHCFQSVLSFVTIASFASSCALQVQSSSFRDSRKALLKKAAAVQPFDIQKSASGCLRIRVSDEFISQLMEEGTIREGTEEDEEEGSSSGKETSKVCTTAQLQKDYTMLVGPRMWKPKLETIKEKEKRKLSSFGIKRRKKSQPSKSTQKPNNSNNKPSRTTQKPHRSSEQLLHSTSSTKPSSSSSKSKIKIKYSRK